MSPAQRRRLTWVVTIGGIAGLAVALILFALKQNINLFYTPTQINQGEAPNQHHIRVGGVVVPGSIKRADDSLLVQFDLTDNVNAITVNYTGILPDLFREGQGIVALGELRAGSIFMASQVLAKHDETYMPPEVADTLVEVD